MIKTAFLLAAGRGERMRPLTDHCPKPMLAVQGIPLIEHHLRRLKQAGITHIVINHAHLGDQIRRHFHGNPLDLKIQFSPEPPGGLEAGGGILHALPVIGDQPFVMISADVLTDYPFQQLTLPSHAAAHFVLIPKPAYRSAGDFGLTATQQLCDTPRDYTFGGIAVLHPQAFTATHPQRLKFKPLIQPLLEAGRITGECYTGKLIDIGTPERLANER